MAKMIKDKKVFVSGSFNIIHPGHLRLLRFAKNCGNKLIVGILSDDIAGSSAHVGEKLRLESIKTVNWVDEAFIISDSIEQTINDIEPEIIVKGKEHESRFNSEEQFVAKYGGKLLFSSGENLFSSLDLIHKEFQSNAYRNILLPNEFMDRNKIDRDNLKKIVQNFSNLKVAIIGDCIIDEYITCQPLGMSHEDPSLVVSPIDEHRFVGGAAIVAAHGANLGASSYICSVTGDDEGHKYLENKLSLQGVHTLLVKDGNRKTTIKKRYRSHDKTLLKVTTLSQNSIDTGSLESIYHKVSEIIKEIDVIIFSDFNYGCLPQELVNMIIKIAKENKVLISADSQSSSQLGDIGRYHSANLITPTEREARISIKDQNDGLVILAEKLRKKTSSDNIILKLGEEGVLIHSTNENKNDFITDRLPTFNQNPKDISGAGDSMLICSSLALASGANIFEATFLGSLAAGIQISRVGNIPLRAKELIEEL